MALHTALFRAVLHHALTLALALFVTQHLLLRLVLFAFDAHKIILTSPCATGPIVRAQFTVSLDSSRPSTVGLFAFWGGLLDSHAGVAKSNDLGLTILTGANN